MSDIQNLDSKFMDFIFSGLDHGINSIEDSGGPLIPFVMTQIGDTKELKRFVTEKYEDVPILAERDIKFQSPKPDFALIAFDGYVNWEDNKKYDAILVRAFDKTENEGFVFSQRYVPKLTGEGIEPVGNSALLGKEPNLLIDNAESTTNDPETKPNKPWWKF